MTGAIKIVNTKNTKNGRELQLSQNRADLGLLFKSFDKTLDHLEKQIAIDSGRDVDDTSFNKFDTPFD